MTVTKRRPGRTVVRWVWHITDWGPRFEPPDDVRRCRQGPLMYVKGYVGTGSDNTSIGYAQQMMLLKARADRHILRSAFADLAEIAANRSRAYRGFLLDHRFQPAGLGHIAAWIGTDERTAARVLKGLAAVGLMECIPCPRFDPRRDELPPLPSGDDGVAGARRPRSAQAGAGRRPLKATVKRERLKEKVKDRKLKDNTKRSRCPSASGKSEEPKGKELTADQKGRRRGGGARGGAGGGRKTPSPKPTAPPRPKRTTQPNTKPTGSDAGGEAKTHSPLGQGQHPARVPLEKLYDPDARTFAAEVFRGLGVTFIPGSREAKRELANFASAWGHALQSRLGPGQLATLWEHSIRSAQRLGRRPRSKFRKGREAVWRHTFNRRLAAAINAANAPPTLSAGSG